MAFDFPAGPIDGAEFTPVGGPTYVFSVITGAWMLKAADTAPLLTFGIGLTQTANNVDLDAATPLIIGGLTDAPSDGTQYARQDATWSPVIPAGAIISDTTPVGPHEPGQFWWESDTGTLYIWYTDVDGSQWVQAAGAAGGGTAGEPPILPGTINDYWRGDKAWFPNDHINSVPEDLRLTFSAGELHLNDAADGTGANRVSISPNGGATINLSKAASGEIASIIGRLGTAARWGLQLGGGDPETGTSNEGSTFNINRYDDAGVLIDQIFSASRTTGSGYFAHPVSIHQHVYAHADIAANQPGLGLAYGPTIAVGVWAENNGQLRMGSGQPGTGRPGDAWSCMTASAATFCMTAPGALNQLGFFKGSGYSGIYLMSAPHQIRINDTSQDIDIVQKSTRAANWRYTDGYLLQYSGAAKPGGGDWSNNSDARIKNVLGDYTAGLDAILALQPVRYTYKGNDTDDEPIADIMDANSREGATAPYPNSLSFQAAVAATEFIGFVAQDAEVSMPEMVRQRTAYIDGVQVNDFRELDTTPLIYALVNAVKELKAEIEILKGTA